MNSPDSFIDEAVVEVAAGSGGNGCVSFRREKFVPRGGPDGGGGGRGGDVVLVADRGLSTLIDQKLRPLVRAQDGAHGGGNQRDGRAGADAELRLPVGTLVHDAGAAAGAAPLADLVEHGQRVVVARGGRGGRGNMSFATPTRQAPDRAEDGRPGEARRLRLALKLLADVGFVGLPNAGKSTLLRRLSAARPRVGAYPFTTLVPSLGVVEAGARRFVAADLPGLVEGASRGAGLGDRFLRHAERTRVLVHLVDAGTAALEGREPLAPLADWETIRAELGAYAAELAGRTEIVALNKLDLIPEDERAARLGPLEAALRARGRRVLCVSGATGEGLDALRFAMLRALDEADAASAAAAEAAR
ncbi:MAG: GTPase ObgE [Deltaproteobacteria bacterium]|nr:GTPase ObgE [Deltaproteobacteria bacterium]